MAFPGNGAISVVPVTNGPTRAPVNAITKGEIVDAIQYVVNAVQVIVAVLYLRREDSNEWAALGLLAVPIVCVYVGVLTQFYRSFHLYVLRRVIVAAAVVASVATWKVSNDASTTFVQLVFLTVIAS